MTGASPAARMSATYALLRAAADVADHWVQTSDQAARKGRDGAEGQAACARHVAGYVGTQAVALLAGNRVLGLGLGRRRIAAALAVSAVTHYVADRREPLRRLAVALGQEGFYNLGSGLGTGAYALDQAWHHAAEAVAAVVAAR